MSLLTIPDLEAELGVTLPADRATVARSACARASALVCGHLRMSAADVLALEAWQVAAIRAVTLGIARDMFANPLDRASYAGPEGLNFAATPRNRRTLFDSEAAALDRLFLPGFA